MEQVRGREDRYVVGAVAAALRAWTPFDDHAEGVQAAGYHGHRGSNHSNIISAGLLRDLRERSPELREDLDSGKVGAWLNIKIPLHEGNWDADFVVAEPDEATLPTSARATRPPGPNGAAAHPGAKPDGRRLRLVMEHKSIVTAHRNRINRFKELASDIEYSNDAGYNVVVAVTILIGTAPRVLQVVDGVRKIYRLPGSGTKYDEERFEREVGARLKVKDPTIWDQFPGFVSVNRVKDAENTAAYFRKVLPARSADRINQRGLDALLLVPVYYDNVGTAHVDRQHVLGHDFDEGYSAFLDTLANAYARRWGMSKR